VAPKKETTKFTKEIGARVENPTLKTGNIRLCTYDFIQIYHHCCFF